ncbi:MAG: winged helix-turn-helix transcriptional regulator [Alphaproteobacteria bacterium]|nr:winged helix-turn-helix transcriptional regulator [Alphaproteobacteria bacterium]MDE1985022.1 winged helix-turn-helix transcriptional regulator [Alphaproteobacteria bacterium]MDE2162363.1 winged helix-turn-helix transcriptional regulator [Alphaproteobacteria bacterium]MDE2265517.1 winged helix-turn-helix transcriptional regulator [Alphaproteobacteria bacterium]
MKEGPSIAQIAALAGDPARANMLAALMSGKALTASELANEAGVTLQTASSHLGKLEGGGLIAGVKQGRHRYFRLSGGDVAEMLESMMGVAARAGHLRTRTGPSDPMIRKARVCYDHLAGEMGVQLFERLTALGHIAGRDADVHLTRRGEDFAAKFGVDLQALAAQRRPLCKTCLDWSMRRHHLAGSLGAALLERLYALKWATRDKHGRAILFSRSGEAKFAKLLAR